MKEIGFPGLAPGKGGEKGGDQEARGEEGCTQDQDEQAREDQEEVAFRFQVGGFP